MISLRPYQQDCVTAIKGAVAASPPGFRGVAVLPTGQGKTVIFAHIATMTAAAMSKPVIVVVHRQELVDQTIAKLHMVNRDLRIGVVKAERHETDADVIICSVQSLSESRLSEIPEPCLIIVDECHNAGAPTWRRFLDHWSHVDAIGFTATLSGQHLGDVWTDGVVYQRDLLDGIADGSNCDVRAKAVQVEGMSLSDAVLSGGDFTAGSLADILASSHAAEIMAKAYVEHASDRKGIMFCPTVDSSLTFAAELNALGVPSVAVYGSLPKEQKREYLNQLHTGEIQVVVNPILLTEGFDEPSISAVAIARPTRKAKLFIQMVGRGMRPYPGKDDCLVLDLSGTAAEHGLSTIIDLSTKSIPDINDGESLAEAVIRHREAAAIKARGFEIVDVDLFLQSSAVVWNMTHKGVRFVAMGEELLFIWPSSADKELWSVGVRKMHGRGGEWLDVGITLDMALQIGETYAASNKFGGYHSKEGNAWRKRKATPGQVAYATGLGVKDIPENIRGGEISNLIDRYKVSRILDSKLPEGYFYGYA